MDMNTRISDEDLEQVVGGIDLQAMYDGLGDDLKTDPIFERAYDCWKGRDYIGFVQEMYRLRHCGNEAM